MLDAARLNGALGSPPGLWREVRVVEETGSTNADLLAKARSGAGEGLVLVAEAQTSGRGRMGRRWISPPRRSLTFSVLLRPAVPAGLLGWMPLLAGVAVASGPPANGRGGCPAEMAERRARRWRQDRRDPGRAMDQRGRDRNRDQRPPAPRRAACAHRDLAARGPGGRTGGGGRGWAGGGAGGRTGGGAGGGAGGMRRDRGPGRTCGSGCSPPCWTSWPAGTVAWLDQPQPGDADGCGLRAEYLRRSGTVGSAVTVMLPGGQNLTGMAAGIDAAGRLEIRTPAGLVQVSAGDVVHLRGTTPQTAG